MLPFLLSILIGFALGYGVREIISRRRHKKVRDRRVRTRRAADRFEQNELKLFGISPSRTTQAAQEDKKAAVSDPDLRKLAE
jgi:hypothetical protein